MDRPRLVAALFKNETAGIAALESLRAGGVAFCEVVPERGGGRLEEFVRIFFGNGGKSLYAALINHGVAEDVARRLSGEMPENAVVVIAGWSGDIATAACVLEEAGGDVVRGADGGVIGAPRPRQPGPLP